MTGTTTTRKKRSRTFAMAFAGVFLVAAVVMGVILAMDLRGDTGVDANTQVTAGTLNHAAINSGVHHWGNNWTQVTLTSNPTFIGVVNASGNVVPWDGQVVRSSAFTGMWSAVRTDTYLISVPLNHTLYRANPFTFGGAASTTINRAGVGIGNVNFLQRRVGVEYDPDEYSPHYWSHAAVFAANQTGGWIWVHQFNGWEGNHLQPPPTSSQFFLLIPDTHVATWTLGAADAVWPNDPTTGNRTTNVLHGNAPVQTAIPTRPHHTFAGWSDLSVMTGVRTITAQWTPTIRPVIFNPHGGTINGVAGNHTENVTSGQSVVRPSDPVRPGFEFLRWSSIQDGATPWNFATAINTPTTINATNTLHAVWRAITHADIIFRIGNPLNDTAMSFVHQAQNYATLNLTAMRPDHDALNFLGWANTAQRARDRQVDLAPTASITINGNRTLYAVWDIDWNEVTPGIHGHNIITLNFADGIDSTISAQNRQYWSWDPTSRILPTAQYMAQFAQGNQNFTGLQFQGWFDNAQFTGQPITVIPSTTRGEVQLFARWTLVA